MPIPIDIVTRLDRTSLGGVASEASRFFGTVGRDVSNEFNKGFHSGVSEGFRDISSNFGTMGRVAEGAFSKITSSGGIAALGVAGIGLAALGVGKQLYDLGEQWHQITVEMALRTGKLGDDLKTLTEDVKQTSIETAAPIADIGDVAARVAQSLHLTGEPLIRMTKVIADLNEMTGEKLNIRGLGNAFRLFGVDVKDHGIDQLNTLENASQATGIPLNDLIGTLTGKGATAAKEFGLSIGDTAGLIKSFVDAGLPAETAINGLAIALKKMTPEGLGAAVTEIKRLSDIGDSEGAKALASKDFGKGFVFFLDAIKDGYIDVQSLNTALGQTGPTIEQMRSETETASGEFQKLTNQLKVEFAPAADFVFKGINTNLEDVIRRIGQIKELWHGLFDNPGNIPQLPGSAPGVPAVPGITGAPGSAAPGGPMPGQNPLDVFAPTGRGSGRSGAPQIGQGGNSFGAGAVGDILNGNTGGGAGGGASYSNLPSPAAMAGIAKAQALNGLPYVPGTTDCSGYLSQVYSAMTGKSTHFSTMADFAALGFHPGFMPGALNIGVTPLPGLSGHMAGTLPNGVNIESGGSSGGVTYGSGTGAQSKQFGQQWWFMPGYAKGGGVDIVPAMLTPGEHVLTTDDVDAMGGQSGVYGFRNALHRNGGGDITGGDTHKTPWVMGPGNFNPGLKLDTSTTKWSGTPGWYGAMDSLVPDKMGTGKGWQSDPLGYLEGFKPGDVTHAQWLTMITGKNRGWMKALGVQQKPPVQGFAMGGAVGFDGGGFVPNMPVPVNPNNQMVQSFLGGLQQGGGYGGLIADMVQMGLDQQQRQQQGGSGQGMPPGSPASGAGAGPPPGPPPVAGREPAQGMPTGAVGGGGGGGLIGAAAGMFPGGGVVAQLATRTAQFGGQALAIAGEGLMETFLPHGSALGDPSRSWLGRGLHGVSGARPAAQNTSGKAEIPMQPPAPAAPAPAPAPAIGEVHFGSPVQDPQSMLRDIDRLQQSKTNAYGAGMGH